VRPTSALSVRVELQVSKRRTARQWVNNVASGDTTRHVFGGVTQTTVGIGTRVNYTLTPTLSLQLYARPFVSSGDYDSFSELVDPRAAHEADRYVPFDYSGNPDFNVHSFRTTNVLRWEYRPGSALFVVWQQGRDGSMPNGDFAFGRDLGRMFDVPSQNVFLIKVSRWFNF
jgi:hypothetical protein